MKCTIDFSYLFLRIKNTWPSNPIHIPQQWNAEILATADVALLEAGPELLWSTHANHIGRIKNATPVVIIVCSTTLENRTSVC